jgi:hypothetical protein
MTYEKFYFGDINELVLTLAFDPGETTGWCLMGVHDSGLRMEQGNAKSLHDVLAHIEYGQINCYDENEGIKTMMQLVNSHHNAAVIAEDFILDFKQATSDRHTLSPVRITAVLNYELWLSQREVIVQGRSGVKTTCTDTRLKHWGLYDRHSGAHARDATRHAYYHLRTCRGGSVEAAENRHLAWPHLFSDPYDITVREGKVNVTYVPKIKALGEII